MHDCWSLHLDLGMKTSLHPHNVRLSQGPRECRMVGDHRNTGSHGTDSFDPLPLFSFHPGHFLSCSFKCAFMSCSASSAFLIQDISPLLHSLWSRFPLTYPIPLLKSSCKNKKIKMTLTDVQHLVFCDMKQGSNPGSTQRQILGASISRTRIAPGFSNFCQREKGEGRVGGKERE